MLTKRQIIRRVCQKMRTLEHTKIMWEYQRLLMLQDAMQRRWTEVLIVKPKLP